MIFDKDLLARVQAFEMFIAPLGDYAPRCRYLLIDYKDAAGVDHNLDAVLYQPRTVSDEMLVNCIRQEYEKQGLTVSAISDVRAYQILYVRPGFLEECARDCGFPIPTDIATNAKAAGIHPANWNELELFWKKKAAPGATNTQSGKQTQHDN